MISQYKVVLFLLFNTLSFIIYITLCYETCFEIIYLVVIIRLFLFDRVYLVKLRQCSSRHQTKRRVRNMMHNGQPLRWCLVCTRVRWSNICLGKGGNRIYKIRQADFVDAFGIAEWKVIRWECAFFVLYYR